MRNRSLIAGQLRVDVGVGGAVDHAAGGGRELVLLEPVAGRLEQRQEGEQHRQVQLHLRRDPPALGLQPDPAVQVVGDRGDDQHDHRGGEQPVDDERQERQLEDVEADVDMELRVLDVEGHVVPEQQPLLPLARRARARDHSKEQRDRDAHQAGAPPDELAVPLDQLLLGTRRPELRRDAVGDEEVDPQQHEEDRDEHDGERDLGAEHAAPHPGLLDRLEPQVVGVEGRDAAQRRDQQE